MSTFDVVYFHEGVSTFKRDSEYNANCRRDNSYFEVCHYVKSRDYLGAVLVTLIRFVRRWGRATRRLWSFEIHAVPYNPSPPHTHTNTNTNRHTQLVGAQKPCCNLRCATHMQSCFAIAIIKSWHLADTSSYSNIQVHPKDYAAGPRLILHKNSPCDRRTQHTTKTGSIAVKKQIKTKNKTASPCPFLRCRETVTPSSR